MPEFQLADAEVFLEKEWVMDPPNWVASVLDDRILVDIYRVKVEALAELAELQIRQKKIEHDMYRKMAEMLG
jgi:hypothetical protein